LSWRRGGVLGASVEETQRIQRLNVEILRFVERRREGHGYVDRGVHGLPAI
jgi:hypothetical protein